MEKTVIKTRLSTYPFNYLKEYIESNEETTTYNLLIPGHYSSLSNETIEEFILEKIMNGILSSNNFKALMGKCLRSTLKCINILPENFDPCRVYHLIELQYTYITYVTKN